MKTRITPRWLVVCALVAITAGCRSEPAVSPPATGAVSSENTIAPESAETESAEIEPVQDATTQPPITAEAPSAAPKLAETPPAEPTAADENTDRTLPMPRANATGEGAPDVNAEMGAGSDEDEIDPEIMAHIEAQRAALRRLADTYDAPPGAKQLGKQPDLWVDIKAKRVYVDGYVSMQRGPLEMLACPVGTKEHESVVAVFAKSSEVHAALLAIGAESGKPVQWDPEYAPPTGQTIQVWIVWRPGLPPVAPENTGSAEDSEETQIEEEPNPHSPEYQFVPSEDFKVVDARAWVRNMKTQTELSEPWVFAGSEFWSDPEDGVEYYSADAGDMICVSNFRSAMLDVPFRSSADTGSLLFEPFTQRVPQRGTPVRLVLVPQPIVEPAEEDESASDAAPDESILPIAESPGT